MTDTPHPIHDIASAIAAEQSTETTSRARIVLLQADADLSPTLPRETSAEVLQDAVRHLHGVVCWEAGDDVCSGCNAVSETLDQSHGVVWPIANDAAKAAAWVHGQVQQERDRLNEDVERLASERDEARAEVERLRAEAAQASMLLSDADGRLHGRDSVAELAAVAASFIRELRKQRYATLCRAERADADVERLRAEIASLRERRTTPPRDRSRDYARMPEAPRERPTRDELADYSRRIRSGEADDTVGFIPQPADVTTADAAPDVDGGAADGWKPGPWWSVNEHGQYVVHNPAGRTVASVDGYGDRPGRLRACVLQDSLLSPRATCEDYTDRVAAMLWCEAQPEMADVIAAHRGAEAVDATAGDDYDEGAGGTQADDAPADDAPAEPARIVGPREGEDWCGTGCHAGTVPYGYELDASGDEPVLLTHQEEADTMLCIVRWRDDAVSAQAIAKRLNDLGRRSRAGHPWTPSSVRSRILSGYDEWSEVGQ